MQITMSNFDLISEFLCFSDQSEFFQKSRLSMQHVCKILTRKVQNNGNIGYSLRDGVTEKEIQSSKLSAMISKNERGCRE